MSRQGRRQRCSDEKVGSRENEMTEKSNDGLTRKFVLVNEMRQEREDSLQSKTTRCTDSLTTQ